MSSNTHKSPDPKAELRRDPRITTFGFVEVCSENGEPLMDATVREISKRGAQLRLKSTHRLPQRLLIRSSTGQSSNTATLRWVSGVSIGVEFDEEVSVPRKRPDAEERIRIVTSHLVGKPVRQ